jgi:hypothetical protein
MKRALLVGVDAYEHYRPLDGCCNDVRALEPLLARNADGGVNFGCFSLLSDRRLVTRDDLVENIEKLLAPAADVAFFYFAGHGGATEADVSLVTSDGTPNSPGVALSWFLTLIGKSTVPEIIVVLDCCFSGGAGTVPQLGAASALLRPGLSILTAARGDQLAAETLTGRGQFSSYFQDALEGGAADPLGRITVAGVYAYLSELFGPWEQRPTFKANIDRLSELRHAPADLPLGRLRHLVRLFPTPSHVLALDPSYEPTEQPRHPAHEVDFAVLQAGRAAKLVEPVGEAHLYWAAYRSKSCRLTALGRHYWNLVTQDRI